MHTYIAHLCSTHTDMAHPFSAEFRAKFDTSVSPNDRNNDTQFKENCAQFKNGSISV